MQQLSVMPGADFQMESWSFLTTGRQTDERRIRATNGRTIRSVIISQCNAASPRHRLFLFFDDDPSFEVFGEEFHGTYSVDASGEDPS